MTHETAPAANLFDWLDRRTGLARLFRAQMDEPIPGGARIAYVFGSALAFIFLSQVITGIFLALYYVPSADHAHTTVAYITKAVASGSLLRSIHAYGSSAMVILLLLHITQTFLYGSYKGRRELLWLSGCVLFALVLCMAFTGYLLPWDQKAYFATTVGVNISGEMPILGPWLKAVMLGGSAVGTLTLSRFFVAHVIVLPAGIFSLIAMHVCLFRRAGPAGPVTEDAVAPRLPAEPFYPKQLIVDAAFALVIVVTLLLVSQIRPFPLGPEANPADTSYVPRPEWYYIPMFQWLKYWQGSASFIGIAVIPSVLAFLFASLPFLDRRMERRPWKRPMAVGSYVFVLLALIGLGGRSSYSDRTDPTINSRLLAQERSTDEFMKKPFEPEISEANAVRTRRVDGSADPLISEGRKLFGTKSCSVCHGDRGVGGPIAPALIGIGQRFGTAQLAALLKSPRPDMRSRGMPALNVPPDQMNALLAYLNTL